MRIKLLNHYRNVNGIDLKPGFYDSDVDDISGFLANYLVENGHAEDVTPITAPAKVAQDEGDPVSEEGEASEPDAAPAKGKRKT